MRKAVQQIMLGSVTGTEEKVRETLGLMKKAGYDSIELNGFMIRPTPFVVRLLTKAAGMPTGKGGKLPWAELVKASGLGVISVHEDLGTIEREPEKVLEEAKTFGTDKIVITGMYRFDYGSAEAVHGLADRLNKAGEALKKGGVSLLYHNHNCELLKPVPGKTAYDILISETDPEYLNFEFDSYWFTDGGADAKAVMKKLGSRMKLWHINDRGTKLTGPSMTPILKSDSMELGTGNMDLSGMAAIARENGVEGVVLESHKNWVDGSPVKSFQVSAAYLNETF